MDAGLPTVENIDCFLLCSLVNHGWSPCKCRTNKSQGSSRTSKPYWLILSSTDLSGGRPALAEARAWRLRTGRLTRRSPVSPTSSLRGRQGVSATMCRRLTWSKLSLPAKQGLTSSLWHIQTPDSSFASFCALFRFTDQADHQLQLHCCSSGLRQLLHLPACSSARGVCGFAWQILIWVNAVLGVQAKLCLYSADTGK